MKKFILFILILVASGVSFAEQASSYMPYFVSGVLRLNGTDATIKIVQGMVVSDSPTNAKIIFTELAAQQFPQYTLVDILASNFSQLYKTMPTSSEPKKNAAPQIILNGA